MQFTSSTLALLATITASLAAAVPTTNIASRRAVLHTRDNICGVAPSNTTATAATNEAASMTLDVATNIAAGCLDFCKSTTGCLSVEYGVTETDGEDTCLMFSEAASALAVPTTNQSLVAYDVDCAETY